MEVQFEKLVRENAQLAAEASDLRGRVAAADRDTAELRGRVAVAEKAALYATSTGDVHESYGDERLVEENESLKLELAVTSSKVPPSLARPVLGTLKSL
jgi:hypothetical protein